MEGIIRVIAVYVMLLIVFRLAGKRTLNDATTFDFLLLLIISETTQQALVRDDPSFTHSAVMVVTFVGANVAMSAWKQRSKAVARLLEGEPVLLVEHGRLIGRTLDKERVDEDDILEAARERQGLERIDQIKYAILERTGRISIIPRDQS
ncbi:MAG: DUF421 domain-containing protein [Phycisphaerales bacterium]|nr:DUF421 domain-containing protein [Phycisphaerales bacterium]